MKEARPAFYALGPGAWQELVSLIHPPYTVLHLSFAVIGAALAPEVRLDRLAAVLVSFFLAVGVAAHFLDELHGRPMRTGISSTVLAAGATTALLAACAIGIAGVLVVSPLLLVFIAAGAFAVLAYNLELFGGAFHGDIQFGLMWGAFPFFTAYWVMDESFGAAALPGTAACFALAMVQRSLSNPVREVRRRVKDVEGELTYNDGRRTTLTKAGLLAGPELALTYLAVATPLLALGLLALRLS
ncbi:MAG: hypothetical protein GEU28_06635 [Dehalococcoidia bacterium]|nr:hypothetical protein [Dehalococcoidia bacterium]